MFVTYPQRNIQIYFYCVQFVHSAQSTSTVYIYTTHQMIFTLRSRWWKPWCLRLMVKVNHTLCIDVDNDKLSHTSTSMMSSVRVYHVRYLAWATQLYLIWVNKKKKNVIKICPKSSKCGPLWTAKNERFTYIWNARVRDIGPVPVIIVTLYYDKRKKKNVCQVVDLLLYSLFFRVSCWSHNIKKNEKNSPVFWALSSLGAHSNIKFHSVR